MITYLTFFSLKILGLQCAMCRAVLETGADAETAKSLNDGIVYLMVVPYILVGVVGYAVYRQFYKK
ncbi:MAG: Uncharacterised protein [Bacteroidota bacterium]|nr:MAG: Uncharacterised protein [Bacteroidota bacterium]